jgi:hypothetical protein
LVLEVVLVAVQEPLAVELGLLEQEAGKKE